MNDVIFEFEDDEGIYPVATVPRDSKFQIDTYYAIGLYLYKYIGIVDTMISVPDGCIAYVRSSNKIMIRDHNPADTERYAVSNIIARRVSNNVNSILSSYCMNFASNNSIMKNIDKKLLCSGDGYIPELSDQDDDLTRLVKLMIIHQGYFDRSKYKNDPTFADKHKGSDIDNMISSLNGRAGSTTITRFLDWSDMLDFDWEFTLEDDGTNTLDSLNRRLVISNTKNLTCDFGDITDKTRFKVPLSDQDDPLKRLIKVALIYMYPKLNMYKDKCSTPHMLNNMRSALKDDSEAKGKKKMMIKYFRNWCEILGLRYTFSAISRADGYVATVNGNYDTIDTVE